MALRVDFAVYCHIGHRSNNEDNFYANGTYMDRDHMNAGARFHGVATQDAQIYAVCDGMGGMQFGEEASLRAVEALRWYQESCPIPDSVEYLNDMVARTSRAIDEYTMSRGMRSGESGSTLAMLVLRDGYFRAVHVGDSRVYRLRNGALARLTRDDSLVQAMVDRGELTPDQAWVHPRKNVITRHLGMPEEEQPLYPTISKPIDLRPGDRFIICSDGLSDALHDTAIQQIASHERTAENTAGRLARTALADTEKAGVASDNITVIVLDVLESGQQPDGPRRFQHWSVIRTASAVALLASLGGLAWSLAQLAGLLL